MNIFCSNLPDSLLSSLFHCLHHFIFSASSMDPFSTVCMIYIQIYMGVCVNLCIRIHTYAYVYPIRNTYIPYMWCFVYMCICSIYMMFCVGFCFFLYFICLRINVTFNFVFLDKCLTDSIKIMMLLLSPFTTKLEDSLRCVFNKVSRFNASV